MTAVLVHDQYGKADVHVSKIKRLGDRHEFVEATVTVLLEGDFAASFTVGDNRQVVATDSIRNTVYLKATDDPWHTIESFGLTLARHFIDTYEQVRTATVTLREHVWHRIGDAATAFTGCDSETPTTTVRLERGTAATIDSGISELMIAKTTDSAFRDFVNDEYRTLPDADDRILATSLTATWRYADDRVDFAKERSAIRTAMLEKFANHMSLSVQQSLHLLGQAALDASPAVTRITLVMPNRHHLKFNLAPFGRENNNDVFHVTSEPAGWISGTLERR